VASESLSQSEIDALLSATATGPSSEPVVAEPSADGTVRYDFRRPNRISKEKLRSLEMVYDRFARSLENWLGGRVRGGVQLRLQGLDHFSFGEFAATLPTPCAAYTFSVNGAPHQQGLIDFGHEFAYFLVDRLFGGAAAPAFPSRSLTPIERMVVRSIADRVLVVLQDVWQDYVALELSLVGFESIPEVMRVASPEDPVLVASLEVTMGETQSLLQACLPFAALESFFEAGIEGRTTVPGSDAEQLASRAVAEGSLRATRTRVAVRLPAFDLPIRNLVALTVGQVLETPVRTEAPVEVYVGSQRRFRAMPGRLGTSLAIRLTEGLLDPPEPDALPLSRLST
jgi:flagellar motor switch protein FliM